MLLPPPILTADIQAEVRIVSPSGRIQPEYIDGAKRLLTEWGLYPTEGRFAREAYGRFAGTPEQRAADLQAAIDDPSVQAIWCSRGGYGLAQIIDRIDFTPLHRQPKWLIGFSDITVLHNALSRAGVCSLHAIMAKHLCELAADSQPVTLLKDILSGHMPQYHVPPHPLNRYGEASGRLAGGNLSVLMGLRGSAFDADYDGALLFIEDVSERPYHVDRMMQNLRLSGIFTRITGLVIGQFSHIEEDPQMLASTYELIARTAENYTLPVCFNFPVGHVEENLPLIVGAHARLQVNGDGALLSYEK